MSNVKGLSHQASSGQTNGSSEILRLSALVEKLQADCEKLREALAAAEHERNLYLRAIYEDARQAREFEHVDVASLQAITTGPVEIIQ